MNQIIKGKTIDLKPLHEEDIEQLRTWRNSKEVSDFMLSRSLISKEHQEAWYQKIKNDPYCVYWIILSKDGVKLGMGSLTKINHNDKSAEPGLYIGVKEHRNSFFGMEANYLVLKYAFEVLELKKIYGSVLASNTVALKMNLSFGYTIDNLEKDSIMVDGVGQDVYKISADKEGFCKSRMALFFKKNKPVRLTRTITA